MLVDSLEALSNRFAEFVEIFNRLPTVDRQVVVIRTQRFVATALNVQRDEIESEWIASAEQEARKLRTNLINYSCNKVFLSTHPKRDRIVDSLHRFMHQSSQDFIEEMLESVATGIVERVRQENNFVQSVLEFHEQPALHSRMTKAKGGASELVGHAGVDVFIEVVAVAFWRREQRESVHRFLSNHQRQPLVERDVLDFSHNNAPGFLVNGVVGPVRIQSVKRFGNAIVLASKQKVKCDQCDVLIDSNVASHEASGPMSDAIF